MDSHTIGSSVPRFATRAARGECPSPPTDEELRAHDELEKPRVSARAAPSPSWNNFEHRDQRPNVYGSISGEQP